MESEESKKEGDKFSKSYGYWEWHLKYYPEIMYTGLTKQGKYFTNIEALGMIFCSFISLPTTCVITGFFIICFNISKNFHGLVGGIMIVISALFTWYLTYLVFPTIAKFAFSDNDRISEEEMSILLNRRIPKSFVLNTPVSDQKNLPDSGSEQTSGEDS